MTSRLPRASRRDVLPRRWFLTDARLGDRVWTVLAGLPQDVGVIVRVKDPKRDRRLALHLIRACRKHGLTVLLAGPVALALELKADGAHLPEAQARRGSNRRPRKQFYLTAAAHSRPALIRAARLGVNGAFLSPVFPTRSHPNARTLGPLRFGLLKQGVPVPVLALGGVDEVSAKRLAPLRPYGWGAIDAWLTNTFTKIIRSN